MQVLLRRTPPAKLFPSIAAYYTKKSSYFVGIKNNIRNPKNQTCTFFSPCSRPPSMATIAGSIPMKQRLRFTATVPSRFYSTNCRICRCALSKGRVGRAWVGLKEGQTGSGTVWCHTASGGVGLKRSDEFGLLADGESVKKSERGLSSGEVGVEDRQRSEKGVSLVSGTVEKPVRLNRRHKSSPVAAAPPENPDLLKIPGVGPRNLRKLVEKGIEEVAQLKKLYRDKFFGKSNQKMVEYLQSSVGIIHRNHAESITTFIRKSVDDEVKDSSNSGEKPAQKKRLTFCVEGNISVGKSTFLQRIANETLELRDLVEIVPEPINKWQDVGPDHFNVLDAFYTEPQRYAYTFQNYVFVTRVMQERESSGGIKPLRLMERSVFSDRMVFVRAVHEANWMNEMEISIYDSWFDPVVSTLPGLIPDGFIYLRASPDTCHKRMMLRKRSEEGGVSLDYLRGLHEKHENWLFPFESGNHGILSISKLPIHLDSSLHPDIRDRVFYLEGEHMHSSIQKVPALVLDCEPNIDFNRDIEAKRQYARQVAEFFEFVKKKNEAAPLGADKGAAAKGNLSQVMLPHKGLWVPPEGFPESALKSMNFRGAMSYTSG